MCPCSMRTAKNLPKLPGKLLVPSAGHGKGRSAVVANPIGVQVVQRAPCWPDTFHLYPAPKAVGVGSG